MYLSSPISHVLLIQSMLPANLRFSGSIKQSEDNLVTFDYVDFVLGIAENSLLKL